MDDVVPAGTWWLSLALINAGLAEQKGRSRLNWFLLSLFLGPLATAFVVVWERPDSTAVTWGDTMLRYRSARAAKRAADRTERANRG